MKTPFSGVKYRIGQTTQTQISAHVCIPFGHDSINATDTFVHSFGHDSFGACRGGGLRRRTTTLTALGLLRFPGLGYAVHCFVVGWFFQKQSENKQKNCLGEGGFAPPVGGTKDSKEKTLFPIEHLVLEW